MMQKTIVHPSYKNLEGFLKNLPAVFKNQGEVVLDTRNTIKVLEVDGVRLNVKSFKVPHIVNRFAYTFLRSSKAERSYKYGQLLLEKEFSTPQPVGYVELRENGLLSRSFYISLHEEFDGGMHELRTGTIAGREELLTQFARFSAHLHNERILHLDYSSGNILYKKKGESYEFYLVDLNRMEFGKEVSFDTACFIFRRLWGSDEMIAYIANEYAHARGFDEHKFVKKTLEEHTRFWKNFQKKYSYAKPYEADE